MVMASDYPFMDILGTMIIFFAWVMWFWLLIVVLTDVFRRHDITGWGKAAWTLFMFIVPLIGVLFYLGFQGKNMGERNEEALKAAAAANPYAQNSAAEIEKAKSLLDSGAITPSEYETLKVKALS